jgi:Leucine-rich repeat (LRR) protein
MVLHVNMQQGKERQILSILNTLNIKDIDALYSRGELSVLNKEKLDSFFIHAFKQKGAHAVFPVLKRFIYFYDIRNSAFHFTDYLHHFLNPSNARIIARIHEDINARRPRRLTFDCRPAHFSEVVFNNTGDVTELHLNVLNLETFPHYLCLLERLEVLDLGFNAIGAFPSSIKKLCCLTCLDLSHNDLESVPPQIKELPSLKRLNLKFNNLTTLPAWMKRLNRLQYLDVSHNKLHSFPAVLYEMKNLKVLTLDFNQIDMLSKHIAGLNLLEELHLEHNRLTSLPRAVCELESLKVLNISYNSMFDYSGYVVRRLKERNILVVENRIVKL